MTIIKKVLTTIYACDNMSFDDRYLNSAGDYTLRATFNIAGRKLAELDVRGRRVNVIACCVPEVVADRRNWWYKSGFMSRLLTLKFNHSLHLQLAIHKAIQNGEHDERSTGLRVPLAH